MAKVASRLQEGWLTISKDIGAVTDSSVFTFCVIVGGVGVVCVGVGGGTQIVVLLHTFFFVFAGQDWWCRSDIQRCRDAGSDGGRLCLDCGWKSFCCSKHPCWWAAILTSLPLPPPPLNTHTFFLLLSSSDWSHHFREWAGLPWFVFWWVQAVLVIFHIGSELFCDQTMCITQSRSMFRAVALWDFLAGMVMNIYKILTEHA